MVVPTLALTVLAMVATAAASRPVYEVSASVILLVPNEPDAASEAGRNPYLDLSGSLATTAQAVADVLNSPATRARLAAAGVEPSYEVQPAERLPTLSILSASLSPDRARTTVEAVIEQVGAELQRLQDAVRAPPDQRIAPAVLVEPSMPVSSRGNLYRGLAALAALGVLASLSLALIAENLSTGTRDRSAAATEAARRAPAGEGSGGLPAPADRPAASVRPPG